MPKRKEKPQMAKVREASQILGLTDSAVLRAIRRGEIPASRVGRHYLIPRAVLESIVTVDGQVRTAKV